MIGNDIIDIDLARAERKSENLRYLQKVCSHREIQLILSSEDPELYFWILWSMKETAYKAHQRAYGLPRKINPKDFQCQKFPEYNEGIVTIAKDNYRIQTQVSSNFIYSQTADTYYQIYSDDGRSKNCLLNDFLGEYHNHNTSWEITKSMQGIPEYYLNGTNEALALSISQHGKFTAFAIPLINS